MERFTGRDRSNSGDWPKNTLYSSQRDIGTFLLFTRPANQGKDVRNALDAHRRGWHAERVGRSRTGRS